MTMRRLLSLLPAFALMMALLVPTSGQAGAITGGVLNSAGERSHNVAGAWPEFFYVWEGYTSHNLALGPRVSLQLYPFAWSVGMHVRMKLLERGKFSMALAIVPTFNVAGFGGSRATYTNYVNGSPVGRGATFRPSFGPGGNVALRAAIDVRPQWRVNLTFENPLAFWVRVGPGSWWLEWPMSFTGGAEYEINEKTSIFGRAGAGPSIAFVGTTQLLGIYWNLHVGAQFRY